MGCNYSKNLLITCIDETDTDNPGQWVSEDAKFDVVFLCYSESLDFVEKLRDLGVKYFLVNSGKWKNFRWYFREFGFGEYEYFWFPDPDQVFCVDDVNLLFEIARLFRFDLCQPGISKNSYMSHKFLRQYKHGTVREVDFVEVMCPMFSLFALEKLLWTFDLSYSGYGLDLLWSRYFRGYVIDYLGLGHPRPQGFSARALSKGFPDPDVEMWSVLGAINEK